MKIQWVCMAPNCNKVNEDNDLLTDEPTCKDCGLDHTWQEVRRVDTYLALMIEKVLTYEASGDILFKGGLG